ncbi:NADP-dependent oxidoreductase [Clavibacter michiganensis subsp. phaseoli]|uniref:NADP-dependent oxidoreductase n=1 Tax=Clavibacter phaseoli TaxID=1734031 RepID=A0A8I0VCH5_9MICO|nr:NADP-dependent oxidoreductase [Clavibacter phaseoli]MBF4630945.1 NADP-dependent oxidoreductase [Clavibacter phaseoli]
MKAVVLTAYRKPLVVADVPEPTVGSHDVLVRVEAAGLNHLDEKLRAGEFRSISPLRLPTVLGHDVAGTVLEVGSAVRAFRVGDEVFGRVRDGRIGTFAERVAVDEADLAPVPERLSLVEAASLPLVALTAWQALVVRGKVGPGQRVLVHAGSGGVGSIAIQLAAHLGATVATTAGAANADFVRGLGADVVIDHRAEDFAERLSGYDLVLDSRGGDDLDRSLRVLAPGGLAVGISGPPDPDFARAAGLSPVLRLAIAGISARVRRAARKAGVRYSFLFMEASGAQLREVSALVAAGAIRPVVGKAVPFGRIPEELGALGSGVRGKVVATGSWS